MRRFILCLFTLLTACSVGPDYEPTVPSKVPGEFLSLSGDSNQPTSYSGDSVQTEVWKSFEDDSLNFLVEQALMSNREIMQALARLEANRALRSYRPFSWAPTITARAANEQSQGSANDPFNFGMNGTMESFELGAEASWEIDLFGTLRRQFDVIESNYQASRANVDAVKVAVVAEVVQSYFSLRGTQALLEIQQRNLGNLNETVQIFEARLDAGRGTPLELAQTKALAAQVAARVPETDAAISRQLNRIATLTALPMEDIRSRLSQSQPLPELPDLVAIGSPEQWLRRRPDVAEAEQHLAAAIYQIGIEVADYYPQLNLIGSFGWTSATQGTLLNNSSERWRWGPEISWRFLDLGRVRLQVKEAEARADVALAQFEQTVLLALEETENAFSDLRALSIQLVAMEEAKTQSREAARMARVRFDQGAINYLEVLDAERTALEIEDAYSRTATASAIALSTVYRVLAGDFARSEDRG